MKNNGAAKRFINHPSQLVKAECVRMHVDLNYGVTAIANRTNTNKSLVRKWLIQQGVYTTGNRSRVPILRREKTKSDIIKSICSHYRSEIAALNRIENASNRHPQIKRYKSVKKNRKRLDTDVIYRAKFYLRKRLKNIIRTHRKGQPTQSISHVIGCTSEHLMSHIQTQFRDGMTWDNMGKHWELDHIRPLSSFDLTKDEDISAAGHWTNVQPLLVRENRRKGDVWP
jgi:hypothetical protein